MEDKFVKNIKKQLQEHRVAPPEMAWDTISTALDRQSTRSIWKRWLSTAAILALPLSFAVIMFYYFQSNEIPSYTQNSKTINVQSKTQNTQINKSKNDIITPDATEREKVVSSSKTTTYQPASDIAKVKTNFNLFSEKRKNMNIPKRTESKNVFRRKKENELKQKIEIAEMQTQEKQEEFIVEKKNLQIAFSPYTGVSNIMSLSDANLITSEMNKFAMTNKTAITYGSKIGVQINSKLQLRSGIGIVNIKQDTYGIPLTMFAENTTQNFNMTSTSNLNVDLSDHNILVFSDEIKNNAMAHQTLSYELQFIEIPLEVEYRLFQFPKFGFFTTTGLSALLRNKNNIYVNDNHKFAKSTNINKTSFSANMGVKFNYELNSNLSVNIEPQVKYLFNTITNNNEIKPYVVEINLGFSWKLFDK